MTLKCTKWPGALLLLAFLELGNMLAAPPGLYVVGKELMKDGKSCTALGVNYFDLFGRSLRNEKDDSGIKGLEELSRAGIPFARFMCGGYWPAEQKMFLTNRAQFFNLLDRVVRAAEKNNFGLIPSLFWNMATVPDLVGETIDQYGNPQSKTLEFIAEYTSEVVSRYRSSPAIWAWEFGNEYNLACDLPNASEQRPPIVPHMGTATSRSTRDELKFNHLKVAMKVFADNVRKLDTHRLILTGHAAPRPTAWNNFRNKSWALDDRTQYRLILTRDNPEPFSGISVHLYPDAKNVYPGRTSTLDEFMEVTSAISREEGQPLFVGEFGASARGLSAAVAREQIAEFIKLLKKHKVPLAAFWVFDLPQQEGDFNVSFSNGNAEILKMIADANRGN